MANRILRDWTDSETIDKLSFQSEVLFTRLFMKADDYGCFHANPKLVKAALFPLKDVRESDVSRWLDECQKAGLIAFYSSKGKQYLTIPNFGQRLRAMKRRFPVPPTYDSNPRSDDSNPPVEKKIETETESRKEGEKSLKEKNLTIEDSRGGVVMYTPEQFLGETMNSQWLTDTAIHFKLDPHTAQNKLKGFADEQKLTGGYGRALGEIKKHFFNTIKKQEENGKHTTTSAITKKVTPGGFGQL